MRNPTEDEKAAATNTQSTAETGDASASGNKNDDDSIDDSQLEEYKEELNSLQGFPDKVSINLLSMVAEDFSDRDRSAERIYSTIRERLLHCDSSTYVLPVMYVLDSILKNNHKQRPQRFRTLVEQDAADWMPKLHKRLDNAQRQKLQKVWKTWNNDTFRLFDEATWKAMGKCFAEGVSASSTTVSGIARTKDGALILASSLRKEMQNILDDMQSDITNELEKVSLERLAEINPDLLSKIKTAAQESLRPEGSLFTDSTDATASNPNDWSAAKLDVDGIAESLESLAAQHHEDVYTQTEALQMIQYLAASQAFLKHMRHSVSDAPSTAAMETTSSQKKKKKSSSSNASKVIDPSAFTNDGIKIHNDGVIALLYEIGLPYVSQADARRFRTQLELSHHLDALFRKKQVAKTMVATQERGWYQADAVWCKDSNSMSEVAQNQKPATANQSRADTAAADSANEKTTYRADESRDHCVVCGNLFKMVMDHEEDEYVYENCREISVINDDAAATERSDQLVHVTCWNGLGSPDELTFDQTVVQDVSERYM